MPILSEFFGIKIQIRYLDHNPPHIYAEYNGQKVLINIETGAVKGNISERALRMILEWLDLHRNEVLEAWNQASVGCQPDKIEPLL